KIQIMYETRKDSSALYWLRSDQTSDGTHPMLITNNKFTYARGIFPCQDSPSVRFTYTAEISVPKDLNFVTICGVTCNQTINDGDRCKHIFFETIPMPSYAMIIIVGSLKDIQYASEDNVTLWAENKFIEQSKIMVSNIIKMLTIAKALCGSRQKDKYNICVLPPNIPEIELQCLSMIFVSSMLLNEDLFTICSTVAQKVAQSWAGGLVTCENFQHLWLNKSFSTFISREIIHRMYNQHLFHYEISFLERKTISNMIKKTSTYGIITQKLVPNLKGILSEDITKYVPDEMGYLLLKCLQNSLGGPKIFESYLKCYMTNFCFKSINTDDWINHLHNYFVNKFDVISFM
ncbi:Leukotriene A-4 hydrolase, partial [Trachymyrmex zeteki]